MNMVRKIADNDSAIMSCCVCVLVMAGTLILLVVGGLGCAALASLIYRNMF